MPLELNRFLYDHFDPEGYFELHGKKVYITDKMVGKFFGIRYTGEKLEKDVEENKSREFAIQLGMKRATVKVSEFTEWFSKPENKCLLTDEWKRRVVMLVLGFFGLPSVRQGLRSDLASYVMDLEKLKNVNWAGTWLDFLKKEQKKAIDSDRESLGGCTMILIVSFTL